ncbi:MAG: hypothetical protein IJV93_03005 [Lentisphaeria bacterium]|nr:hypothetical protein [Lentisphaeria bacterium]
MSRSGYIATAVASLFLIGSGCHLLLPEGDPPAGAIVDNPQPEKVTREAMILSLGSRIAASSMEHFPGGSVTIDSDAPSAPIARTALKEAENICGVRFAEVAAVVLHGRRLHKETYEFELFYFSRSLWRCTYVLKRP